ncbi:MAG: hypothetical protein SNJ82_01355 [Gemmataceae bacterium]
MPVARCPHCSVALLDEEANGSHCPACGGELRPAGVELAAVAPPTLPTVSRPWGWMIATAALTVLVVLQLLSWPSSHASSESATLAELRSEKEKAEQAAIAARAEIARIRGDMQKQIAMIREEELAKRTLAQAKQTEAEQKIALAEQRAKQAEERLSKEREFLNLAEELVKLNRPEADYLVQGLNEGRSLTLIGKVNTLRVEAVQGAQLDASRLEAKSIVFYQGIRGRSVVKLYAPQGKVSLASVQDLAKLEIDAPGGRTEIRDINGEPELRIRTKELQLHGRVDGQSQLQVTLTQDGSLKFVRLLGKSKLVWKKDHPNDPEPAIQRGEVHSRAVFEHQ